MRPTYERPSRGYLDDYGESSEEDYSEEDDSEEEDSEEDEPVSNPHVA